MNMQPMINRKARVIATAAIFGALWAGAAIAQNGASPAPGADIPLIGAYDPHGTYGNDEEVSIEHLFLPWEDVDLNTLSDAQTYAGARERSLLITVEPWNWSREWRITPAELKDGILAGRYDANMTNVCRIVAEFDVPVVIRWGHEMEDESGQFTWADWAPDDYVAAYRRMIDLCRAEASNVEFMWSPLGHDGLQAYYPGDDYVDIVGLSVFGLQAYDNDQFGRDRRFADILGPRYELVAGYGKPIVVAELGFNGSDDYVAQWQEDIRRPHEEFPQLTSVVYFNDREVHPWPGGYGYPDWRLR